MADKMGFVIPFKKAKDSTNPLIAIANQYVADGKTSVDWCFSTMPSEEWKNGVGTITLQPELQQGESVRAI